MTRIAAKLLPALALAALAAGARPFELYQPIIDRCPFGDPPDDPSLPPDLAAKSGAKGAAGAEAEISKEQELLEKAVRVSVFNVLPDGRIMVGFSDLSDPKRPLHHYLELGAEKHGWLVKEADPVEKRVLLVKDGAIEIERRLGEKSAAAAPLKGKAAAAARQPPRPQRSQILGGGKSSLRQKHEAQEADRKAREEEIAQEREERRRKEEEEREERRLRDEERRLRDEEMRGQLEELKNELKSRREEAARREAEEAAASTDGEDAE